MAETPGNSAPLKARLGRLLHFLRNHLWIWPLLAALLILLTGWLFKDSLQRTNQDLVRSQLQTLLDSERRALVHWLNEQEANVRLIAADSQFIAAVEALLARPDRASLPAYQLAQSTEIQTLQDTFKAVPDTLGYPDFVVDITAAGWLLEHLGTNAPYLIGGAGALALGAALPLILPRPQRPDDTDKREEPEASRAHSEP